jgi:Zn-dependent M28 family amino/carboxypeptidase
MKKIGLTGIWMLIYFYLPAQHFKKHIAWLSSPALHGRSAASANEKKAADYIKKELLAAGCNWVKLQQFSFQNKQAINVIGMLNFKKDSTIIISAHYDHLGLGSDKSMEIVNKAGIYPGADDNASGVAMMIELAKAFSKNNRWKYNIVFAGFSAHEAGLFGSDYFSKSNLGSSLKIRAVINFDMVGRLNADYPVVRISGADTDAMFSNYFKTDTARDIHFRFDDSNISLSDLKPFAAAHIPVLNYTTGLQADYHKKSDTEDKINYNGMKAIFSEVQSLLEIFKKEKN